MLHDMDCFCNWLRNWRRFYEFLKWAMEGVGGSLDST